MLQARSVCRMCRILRGVLPGVRDLCVGIFCDWRSGGGGGGLSVQINGNGAVLDSSLSLMSVTATNNIAGKIWVDTIMVLRECSYHRDSVSGHPARQVMQRGVFSVISHTGAPQVHTHRH